MEKQKTKKPTKKKERDKPRVTVAQLRILLMAVERDPSLYNIADSDMISYLNIEKWIKLMNTLNGCYDSAMMNSQSWKYMLRFWADNLKKGPDVMSKERLEHNKKNDSLTLKEARTLTRLERRFHMFLKREEAKQIVDVTYIGNFGIEQPKSDIVGASNNSVKVKVQLMSICDGKPVNDENACPDGPKKRVIRVTEDDPVDPADVTRKLRDIYDQTFAETDQMPILEHELEHLQVVSRELETHIATIQTRIHMIKDLWKHRCGDN